MEKQRMVDPTPLHCKTPWVVVWWSAAFPGFGHLLLSQHLKGIVFIASEVLLNVSGNLNLAMVYSFTGQFDKVKEVVEPQLIFLYIPLYFFVMWDSYRNTLAFNKRCLLAQRRQHDRIDVGTNRRYHDFQKRKPWIVVMWSLFLPGTGHLSLRKIVPALIILISWVSFSYLSHFFGGLQLIFSGEVHLSTTVFNPGWLLFLPSVYGFALYSAYIYAVENNNRFDWEQSQFLKRNYQHSEFKMPRLKMMLA
ncbi:hypothetical protein MUO14_13225 [Halobacillus shinanisalinarum]|uniref:Uncharacterized protein n=1 Tax=Halobacillus shinanisalinarum TaxID=2932258 RepID=A0ABY4GTR1_9BACI|nr:hypothetical protein [Halobacillus shinanisalinarum]UOQ91542.1 hypothetical protein MUO14_13225 [Halobacillus shinanisalinarum]